MKYLLDTCVLSDFFKGEANTLAHIKETPPSYIAVSSITLMEIKYGLALNPERAKIIEPISQDFLKTITLLDFNEEDANQAATVRADLRRQGKPIGSYDILLAGTALSRQLILVTSNTKEFIRLENLTLENWRLSSTKK